MVRCRSLAACIAALALCACGRQGASTFGAAPGEITFAVLATSTSGSEKEGWKRVLADLAARTGVRIELSVATRSADLVDALKAHRIDAGWFSNRAGLEAVRSGGGEVFARTSGLRGLDAQRSLLIVALKKLDLAKVLKCGRSLTFGVGDRQPTFASLAVLTGLFAPRDIDPKSCFKQVRGDNDGAANLIAVAAGRLDVAAIDAATIQANRAAGRHEADQVRVIWRSPPAPEEPIIWRKSLDPAVKEQLRQFFLTYGQGATPEAARQRGNLARIGVAGLRPADDNHLLPQQEMEAAALWLDAKRTNDPRKVADARANLEAITARRVALEGRTGAPAAAQ